MGEEKQSKKNDQKRIVILGAGNLLLKDEGIGVHVVQRMEQLDLQGNVELVDGGTAGVNLYHLIEGASKLIIIDCVDAEDEPGAIFRFQPDDVDMPTREATVSFHDITLLEALEFAKQEGDEVPETIIIGVQPKEIEWGLELTPELEKVVPEIIEIVLKELKLK